MSEITYSRQGDYLIPDLTLPTEPELPLGRYALMHRDYANLFDLTQEELYHTVKSAGRDHIAMVQAHPYRRQKHLLEVHFLDGVEVNCHPLYGQSNFPDMVEIATKNRLILTCGGDYHADTYRPKCGMYLPEHLQSGVEIGQYLLDTDEVRLCIHEPNTGAPYHYTFLTKKQ